MIEVITKEQLEEDLLYSEIISDELANFESECRENFLKHGLAPKKGETEDEYLHRSSNLKVFDAHMKIIQEAIYKYLTRKEGNE